MSNQSLVGIFCTITRLLHDSRCYIGKRSRNPKTPISLLRLWGLPVCLHFVFKCQHFFPFCILCPSLLVTHGSHKVTIIKLFLKENHKHVFVFALLEGSFLMLASERNSFEKRCIFFSPDFMVFIDYFLYFVRNILPGRSRKLESKDEIYF